MTIYAGNGFDTNLNVIAQQMGYSANGTGVPWGSMTFNNDQFEYDFDNRLFSVIDTVYGGSPHHHALNCESRANVSFFE